MRFFRKIRKFAIIGIKLGLNPTNWVENSEKSDFSLKQVYTKIICSTINCTSRNCRKHKKIHKIRDSTQYNKIGEKFSPIVIKILAFSQVPQQLHLKERKLLTHKNLKGAINCSQAYCEEDYGKCCKHTPFFFKCTIVSTGVTNTQITKTTNTYGYYKLQHKQI